MTRGLSVFSWFWGFSCLCLSCHKHQLCKMSSDLQAATTKLKNPSKHQPGFQPNFSLPSSDLQIFMKSLSRGHCLFSLIDTDYFMNSICIHPSLFCVQIGRSVYGQQQIWWPIFPGPGFVFIGTSLLEDSYIYTQKLPQLSPGLGAWLLEVAFCSKLVSSSLEFSCHF